MAYIRKPTKRDEDDRKIDVILDFAQKLLACLRDRKPISKDLEADLPTRIKIVSILHPSSSLTASASAFDAIGTELWNGTTHILRDVEEHEQEPRTRRDVPSRTTVLLRVFAFHLLDAAYRASPKRTRDVDQGVRKVKLALKTCRTCLNDGELEYSLKVLEKCSEHVSTVENASPLVRLTNNEDDGGATAKMKELAAEFYVLRAMHAWKSGRLDVAAHVTTKLDLQAARATDLPEKAADLFFEIGKSLIMKSDSVAAAEWLERALAALGAGDVEYLSDDAADLRLSISTKLVKCLTLNQESDSQDRARRIVEQLMADPNVGGRVAVQAMQLDMLHAETPLRPEKIHAVLSRMIRASILTDQTFKIIMQAIHRAKKQCVQVACDVLDTFIRERLLPALVDGDLANDGDRVRLEQACVTLVLFAVDAPSEVVPSGADVLQALLDDLSRGSSDTLSAKAVHAMQTLMWKAAGSSHSSITDKWLELLRHPALGVAGKANKAKIGRKTIGLAVQRNDFDAAREAYFSMPPAAQNETLTQYLVFTLALRTDDSGLALESLETITKHTQDDGKFLYACVLAAQESNMRHIAVAAFHALLDKQPPGVHLPTLLRCTARLLAAELEPSGSTPDGDRVGEIVHVFERAAANIKILRQSAGEQWRAEMQWWSKNAYNLSLKLCGSVHPEHLCRLLATCPAFISNFPTYGGVMHGDDLTRRKMLCHFLSASALIVLARTSSEDEEYSLQCYVRCRQQIREFKGVFDAERANEDTSRRMFEMLKYEVECILRLQQWDQLNAVLQACLDCKHVDRWDTLADLVLIIHSQSSTIGCEGRDNTQMISLIQRIINETWKKDKDLVKVSRWLRLSFCVDLSDGDGAFAYKLLQQAADMARKGYEGTSDQTYPETELQWLVTTAFNKAIDFLSAKEYELSRSWIEAALEVARYAADEGALHAHLTVKKGLAAERMRDAGAVF